MLSVAYVSLGSNLGDSEKHVMEALESLQSVATASSVRVSSLYLSTAVGPPQPDYINAVARLETSLEPLPLLDALQEIERQHGRERLLHWGPRTLDLDLLLFDQQVLDHPRLKVPHPYLRERNFVLIPLAELAPELQLPNGDRVADLARLVGNHGLTRIDNRLTDISTV